MRPKFQCKINEKSIKFVTFAKHRKMKDVTTFTTVSQTIGNCQMSDYNFKDFSWLTDYTQRSVAKPT